MDGRSLGILSAVEKGSDNLPNLDPFHDIDPLTVGSSAFQETTRLDLDLDPAELESYKRVENPDDDDMVTEMNGKYPWETTRQACF